MIRLIRDLRFVPIALVASACLLALKIADLVLDSGYFAAADSASISRTEASLIRTTPDVTQAGPSPQSWAKRMFNFPNAGGAAPATAGLEPLPSIAPLAADKLDPDITGTVATNKEKSEKEKGEAAALADKAGEAKDAKDGKDSKDGKDPTNAKDGNGKDAKDGKGAKNAKDATDAKPPSATVIQANGMPLPGGAERAILERLQARREELDARARELDIREGLIAAAEKRVDGKLNEMKQVEAQIGTDTEKKDEAEADRFKGLVTMYENMKPRDAAKIFDRLEIGVLLEVAGQINPRRMSDILAQMSADSAERLTVELASRAQGATKGSAANLPKIEGRPMSP